jgi:putative PIN family toxin of toxin-antitoxin system
VTLIVVLDTCILVAGLRSRRAASFRILAEIPSGRVRGVISVPLLLEYEAVLKRPEMLRATGLESGDIEAVLNMLAGRFRHMLLDFLWRPQLRDANDEMVLELAVNAGADAIVTFNVRDFAGAAERFGIAVLPPGVYVRNWLERGNG